MGHTAHEKVCSCEETNTFFVISKKTTKSVVEVIEKLPNLNDQI